MSAVFAVFSPLPILLVFLKSGRRWALLASASNLLLVGALGGPGSALPFLVFGVTVAFALGELLLRRKSLEFAVVGTLVCMVAAGAGIVVAHSVWRGVSPVTEVRDTVSRVVDSLSQSLSEEVRKELSDAGDLNQLKKDLMVELPSGLSVLALLIVWLNLMGALRVNPLGLREKLGLSPDFIYQWKAPDFLVWPTLVAGFFLVVDLGLASDVGRGVFKFLMSIYALQGLSILAFFFSAWKVQGGFRMVGYALAVVFLTPLLLGLGFFDLWFDFRKKFRQS